MATGFLYDADTSLEEAAAAGEAINYIALGSDHRSKLIEFDLTSGTGPLSITGIGFQPECLIIFGVDRIVNNLAEGGKWHLGVATDPAEQWAMGAWAPDNVATADTNGSFASDRIISFDGAAGPQAALDSFDADGFTLDRLVSSGTTRRMVALALRGGVYKAGVFTARTSIGSQSTAGVGFAPDCVFFASSQKTADTTDSVHSSISMGAADGTRQHSTWGVAFEGGSPKRAISRFDNDRCLMIQEYVAFPGVEKTVAALTSLDADGWTLDYTVASSAFKVGYLAVQDAVTDQFSFDTAANDKLVTTPIPPKALLGYCTSILAADDGVREPGCSISFSACDENLTERSASFNVHDNPPSNVQQSSRYLSSFCFGTQARKSGGGVAEAGAGATRHDCDIVRFKRFLPQIYRRVIQRPRVQGVIDAILAAFGQRHGTITSEVPDRYDFTEGETGTQIGDGGDDMFDGGNILSTDLADPIPYTDAVVRRASGYFGSGSTYFTAKEQGIFAMVATDIDITSFQVDGNTGADGFGFVEAKTLQTTVEGQLYTIFVKQIYATEAGNFSASPSIVQMIFVKGDGSGITHTWATDTNDAFQKVDGLSGYSEIYYLLVSQFISVPSGSTQGPPLDVADMQDAVTAFLEMLPPVLPGPYDPVPQLVANFPDEFEEITSQVPNFYYIQDGLTGNEISDGGNDMFDGGNHLNTDLKQWVDTSDGIFYTNNVEASSGDADAAFGVGSRYATLKQPGVFVLTTQDIAIDTFWLTGDLGSDAETDPDGGTFSVMVDGRQWTVYWKTNTDNRLSSSADPSVNQMILVPGDGTGITYTFSNVPGIDDYVDEVDGLAAAGIDELHYILLARRIHSTAPKLEDADVIDVAEAFLALL